MDSAPAGTFERAPDGSLRWPAPDRDSPQLGTFTGRFNPDDKLGALLKMEGRQGRSEAEVLAVAELELKRPRRWHKLFERIGILYPGEGNTRLARIGRMLRDAAEPNGLERLVAREVIEVLKRYQFDNPIERSLPEGCDVHPYYAVLRIASQLDGRVHWDEVNREIMRLTKDDQIEDTIRRIAEARLVPGYDAFIGGASNEAGPLQARSHPAETTAPPGKTPEGQLRDQRMTPFLKRVGFSELLLKSPGIAGNGYWTIPEPMRTLVQSAVERVPEARRFATEQEWIEWFCEGTARTSVTVPPPRPLRAAIPVRDLTLAKLRAALDKYEPDLVFPDVLLASLVAALRSGDGKNFIILRGISGTGKSRLVAAIAKAVYGSSAVDMPQLTMVEVRPDWTDGSYLLGHYDPIAGRYVRQRFLDALLAAVDAANADQTNPEPFFVCLDEMNLARVEYYLADCLSAMESGNAVPLDTRGDASIPRTVRWPQNLFLFATVNVDESTHRLSDKVLDRAQVVDTSDIDLLPQLNRWLANQSVLTAPERERVAEIVGEVWGSLGKAGAPFGFRTAKAVARFIAEAKASSDGVLTVDDAIDAQLMQKVLVKLRGEGERWAATLGELELTLGKLTGERRAATVVARMRTDLERLGSFQFWN